jgi:hypothetical protein
VRFLDVYDVEGRAIAIGFVQLVERGNLPAKWWSSIAAENQDDRLRPILRRQPHGAAVIECRQLEIRGRVAYFETSGARRHPKRPERQNQEGDIRNMGHDGAETFWWLAHGGIDSGASRAVERRQSDESKNEELEQPHRLDLENKF